MLPATTGLVAMFPHWDAEVDEAISVDTIEEINRFKRYWRIAELEHWSIDTDRRIGNIRSSKCR
jgi:hypothetical protein